MSDDTDLNEHGNHQGEFRQTVGGWAEYTVHMTEVEDTIRHDVTIPPRKIIPIIFLPGVMGSNLRMTKQRQEDLKRPDNRSWRPDDMVDKSGNLAVATGSGLGGWFRGASPRDRQLVFDPNETEVEYYQYSIENARFFFVDATDKLLWSWPRGKDSAVESIYLQPANAWRRMINPLWVNPANIPSKKGGGINNVMRRLKEASELLKEIEKIFHPNTYSSYCASKEFLSYGEITFKVIEGLEVKKSSGPEEITPSPDKWELLTDDAKGNLTVQAGKCVLKIKLQPPNSTGDETVPSERSAKHTPGKKFSHGAKYETGYEHQNSYSHPHVLASMLYSIVQISKTAKLE